MYSTCGKAALRLSRFPLARQSTAILPLHRRMALAGTFQAMAACMLADCARRADRLPLRLPALVAASNPDLIFAAQECPQVFLFLIRQWRNIPAPPGFHGRQRAPGGAADIEIPEKRLHGSAADRTPM